MLYIGILLIIIGIARICKVYLWPMGVVSVILGCVLALAANVPEFGNYVMAVA